MLDFAPDLTSTTPIRKTTPTVLVEQPTPVVQQQVTLSRPTGVATSYLMKPDAEWGWADLRDYVIHEIEQRHGPQLRDTKKETGIFKGFMSRWGEQSIAIARAAFGPAHNGMWRGAPIAVQRFCKGSDPYFAKVLADRLSA